MRTRNIIFAAIMLGGLAVRADAGAGGRATISLDGGWGFRMDPENKGQAARWFDAGAVFKDRILVPGAWGAQGFGQPTEKVRHSFVGKGWYRRQIDIPKAWRGRRVFLTIGGVHRYSRTWVNGAPLGEHIGYLSNFEYDITRHVEPGKTATLAICVDSKQRWDVDCLTGCVDIIDAMFVQWGGIWGHVALEARNETWWTDMFVRPGINPPSCRVSAVLAGKMIGGAGVRLEILDAAGKTVATETTLLKGPLKAGRTIEISAKIPRAKLWSPGAPHLYTARLSLVKGPRTIDSILARFGLREISIKGPHILLNGRRIFLHGYGDDSIYPETLAPPTDKATYVKRLKLAREYGFNHVRHHSHFLPVEYYEAADEVGMLVSPELPIAYMNYYRRAKGPALELYKTEWSSAIRRLRNHPSILDWCMGNEFWHGLPIAPQLYRIAKSLDPTRPVIDSDGLFAREILAGKGDRATLDWYFTMFDIHNLPLDRPDKHKFPRPKKPVISHETGNYGTFPRPDLIEQFKHNFKPFWLTPVRDKVKKLSMGGEAELWAKNSERLYLLTHKMNIEDMRKNPYISGHHWWLFQDYWTGSNGLVDAYFRPKKGIRPAEVRQFNADVVMLQDALPLSCRAGDKLSPKLIVSNYSPEAIRRGALTYRYLGLPGKKGRDMGRLPGVNVGQGEVKTIMPAEITLPNVHSATKVILEAELSASGRKFRNRWTTWVYPAKIPPPALKVPLFADPVLAGVLARWGAKPIPAKGDLPGKAVYIMRQPSPRVVDAVARGACLVLLAPDGLLPTAPTRFKTSWWLGSKRDCNVGTVVYDNPVTREMAPDGWCDAGWYRLLEGARTYILDGLAAPPEVMVRALDVHRFCRSKALMFQARVGRGSLIVSGLRRLAHGRDGPPEAQWLLGRLIAHAGTLPQPKAEFPIKLLRNCAVDLAPPSGPYVPGYRRMITVAEKTLWHSYREDNTTTYCCRQLTVGTRMEWETAPVPPRHKGKSVTFVFAGGLGWRSQPKTKGFTLEVGGREVLAFDLTGTRGSWKSADGKVRMVFLPVRQLPQDTVGMFYVTVAADMLTAGKPIRFGVVSKGKGSRRWFGLNPYTDVLVATQTKDAVKKGNVTYVPHTPTMPEDIPDTWLTYHLAHPGPDKAIPADPNCAIFYKGRYHLHYIYQSDDRKPSIAAKGHAYAHVSSTDMVHWKWHPTVLTPPKMGHGMFSGTAFLTREGRPAIIYHGWGSGRNKIALALDDTLDKWSETVSVEPKTADGKAARVNNGDPDCWLMGDTYYALGGGKNPTLAKSKDLKNWEFLGKLFHPDFPKDLGVAKGEDISCANMFKIGNKWMLLCISHGLGARYYLGDFKDEKFLATHHALLNWARWDCFAPESLLTPDGRRVMWAWCTPWVNKNLQKVGRKKNFDALLKGKLQPGIQSLPRELSLPKDGVLRIKPLRELEQLRADKKQEKRIQVKSDTTYTLKEIAGDTMELEIVFDEPSASEFGVKVLCGEDGSNGFTISSGNASKTLTVGYINPPFELKENEDLTLRIFIDKSMIEVFANDRQAAVAWHEYNPKDLHVSLFTKGGDLVVKQVTAWKVKSIYEGNCVFEGK